MLRNDQGPQLRQASWRGTDTAPGAGRLPVMLFGVMLSSALAIEAMWGVLHRKMRSSPRPLMANAA